MKKNFFDNFFGKFLQNNLKNKFLFNVVTIYKDNWSQNNLIKLKKFEIVVMPQQ